MTASELLNHFIWGLVGYAAGRYAPKPLLHVLIDRHRKP